MVSNIIVKYVFKNTLQVFNPVPLLFTFPGYCAVHFLYQALLVVLTTTAIFSELQTLPTVAHGTTTLEYVVLHTTILLSNTRQTL